MTGNRVSGPPAKAGDDDKSLAMPSKPPPPPVRQRSAMPPPPAPARASGTRVPPAPARPVLSQPPPPPKRNKPPSVAPARAAASAPPPAPSSRKAPSLPPPLPVQAMKAPSVPPPLPTAPTPPPVQAAVSGLPPWAAPIVESEILPVDVQIHAPHADQEPARAAEAAPPIVEATTEPAPRAEAAPHEAPTPLIEAAAPEETPAVVEAAAPEETPAVVEAAAPEETPAVAEAAAPEEAPAVVEAAAPEEAAATTETAAPEETPAAVASPSDDPEYIEAVVPQPEFESRPLAVEQALVLEHALDAEPAPEAPIARAAPSERDFSSAGSEMPVVLTTPVPRQPESAARTASALFQAGRARLPEAQAWAKKTLRATPRTLVISAPFIALFGIWAAHGIVTRTHRAHAATSAPVVLPLANTTPAVSSLASAFLAAPPLPVTATASVAPPPPVPTVDPAALKTASAHGLPALEALAAKYPGDVQVGIALASEQAHAQRFEAAVSTVDQLLRASPESAQNGKVMGILWRAAQSPASEQTFLSLRTLGSRGTDVAFDLAATPGVRDAVRERARSELANYLAFDASEDTRVATALLLAPDCSTRKSLLPRAEREGGKRTRAMLERFSRGAGCTSSSDGACNSCLMGSPVLAHALERLGGGAKP